MAQEYTIKSWKVWENEDGIVKDNFGNYKGSVLFNEESGEPIDATFKDQPKVGDKKYGDIVEYTTKAGSQRTKFQRADRPQEEATVHSPTSATNKWQARDDMAIRAQWSIGQAVQLELATKSERSEFGTIHFPHIEETAKQLFAMVDRVKGGSESTNPKASDYDDILDLFAGHPHAPSDDEMPPDFLREN